MHKLRYIAIGMLFMVCISLVGSFIQHKYFNTQEEKVSKPWFDIPPQVAEKLVDQYAEVSIQGFVGSGCQIKPGFYLSSLHVVANAILDDTTIAVNDQKAQVVWRSKTDEDYVILTTWAEFDKKRLDFPVFNNFDDNTNIIVVGSPGDQQKLVQPGKILRSAVDDDNKVKKYAKIISAQYIDFGLSGGCIYSEDGQTLLGVLTSKYQTPGSTIGEITIVNRSGE